MKAFYAKHCSEEELAVERRRSRTTGDFQYAHAPQNSRNQVDAASEPGLAAEGRRRLRVGNRLIEHMIPKPPPLQDLFFRKLITEKLPVTVFLVNGLKLQGAITEIDSFSMLIVRGSAQLLIYKHVVATILPDAPLNLRDKREAQ